MHTCICTTNIDTHTHMYTYTHIYMCMSNFIFIIFSESASIPKTFPYRHEGKGILVEVKQNKQIR